MAGRKLQLAQALLFLLAAGDLFLLRRGWLPVPPGALAILVILLLAALIADLGVLAVAVWRRRQPMVRGLSRLLWLAGVVVVFGSGLANWLFSLQGYVILSEGDAAPLSMTSHLQGYEAGPLASADELGIVIQLAKFELLPAGGETYNPRSRMRAQHRHEEPVTLEVAPGEAAYLGALRFQQGAFGFSPRIVILKGESAIFDQVVPFITSYQRPGVLGFQGEFTIEKEDLRVRGDVDVSSLDERMKGHAKLWLSVSQGGEELGSGELSPGHFAELKNGYRAGFAGLKYWTELDISRRNYITPMGVGALLAAIGGLGWLGATLWARSRR